MNKEDKILEITDEKGNKTWAYSSFIDSCRRLFQKQEKYFWFIYKPEHDLIRKERRKSKRDLKYCYIFVGKTKFLAWIDKNTNLVYKADGYIETWILWKKYIFIDYVKHMEL